MGDDAELEHLLRETAGMTTDQLNEYFRKKLMFDPPLPGSLIAGRPLCRVPDSDVKYKSFLEWWFAVGSKAPKLTTEGWATVSGPHATRDRIEAIPAEDWDKLSESEREEIREWAESLPTGLFYD